MSTRTGTTGIAPFVIQDDAIPQPAAYADQLNKGWHTRNTISDRDAIPLHYRGWGMVCVVTNDEGNNGVYQLTRPSSTIADDDAGALMDNVGWKVWGAGGGAARIFSEKPEGGWIAGDIYIITTSAGMRSQALYGIGIFNLPSNSGNPDDWDYTTIANGTTDYIGANIYGGGTLDVELQTGRYNPAVHFYIETPDADNADGVIYNDMYFKHQSLKYEYAKSSDNATYFTVEVLPKVKIITGPPSAADVPDGFFAIINNTSDDTTKLYANIGGTLKSILLT